MTPYVSRSFEARLRQVLRKHRRMAAAGVVPRLREDGLVVPMPRRQLPAFPWRGLLAIAVVVVLAKAAMMAEIGVADYEARVAALSSGGGAGQAVAWLLQPEVVTLSITDTLGGLLR